MAVETVVPNGTVVVAERAWTVIVAEQTNEVEIVANVATLPMYDGPYEIIPSKGPQTLETAARAMRDNLEVSGIPYAAVTNPSGGYTATIG